MDRLPNIEDVRKAAQRIKGEAVRTPLLRCDALDAATGGRVFLKAENLQRTGSFKFRGAWNTVSRLEGDAVQGGIVACSSGNHGQGVALAAKLRGMKATIVMPADAPAAKKDRTRAHGATVVEYDRYDEDRDAIAADLTASEAATFIHPYEHPDVIAGQGTMGLEIERQLVEYGEVADQVLVCAGGGGLMAGIRLAMPDTVVRPVEPAGFDDQARSHAAGRRISNRTGARSVCDAVLTPMPGELSFAICAGKVGEGVVVSDEEALEAMAFAWREMKLVLEPGGAIALAAVLSGKVDARGRCVALTLSGGNVDAALFARAIGA